MANKYQCPLFVWKTGKLLANVHQALTKKWEVRMQPLGEMVEMRISAGQTIEPLTLNLFVSSGKVLWGYIDLPVISEQMDLLQEVTNILKDTTDAALGPTKRRVKFKYEGESIETETTTAEVYSWTFNYGLRFSLQQITRFLTALDSSIREHEGRGLEGNEFFVTYREGNLHLQEPALSFVLVTTWGYYSAFLYLGEESLEIQICDEEKEDFPTDNFDKVVEKAVELFESDQEIVLKDIPS
ncbi:MAG: hypothetical protein ACFFD8_08865 [Candidatus Thorarchaeota archaeon]